MMILLGARGGAKSPHAWKRFNLGFCVQSLHRQNLYFIILCLATPAPPPHELDHPCLAPPMNLNQTTPMSATYSYELLL